MSTPVSPSAAPGAPPAAPALDPTARTGLRRLPQRGRFDLATIEAVLDEALVAHVGFVAGGQPYVIPTLYGRAGRTLYLHGSAASRMLRTLTCRCASR